MTPTPTPTPTPTSDAVLASTRQDADAVESVRRHHAELAGGLTVRVEALLVAAEAPGAGHVEVTRADLVAFCRRELIPHAQAEEGTLYRAAADLPALRLLIGVMSAEHVQLQALVGEVSASTGGVRAAAAARALLALFEPHLAAENEVLLPRLAADPDISLTDLLHDMHHDFAARQHVAGQDGDPGAAGVVPAVTGEDGHAAGAHGGCSCGGSDAELPELDARAIPHAIRHAAVSGAFDAIPAGGSLVLVAPHDPLPLLQQLSDRAGGRLEVAYLERGPQAWRVKLTR